MRVARERNRWKFPELLSFMLGCPALGDKVHSPIQVIAVAAFFQRQLSLECQTNDERSVAARDYRSAFEWDERSQSSAHLFEQSQAINDENGVR